MLVNTFQCVELYCWHSSYVYLLYSNIVLSNVALLMQLSLLLCLVWAITALTKTQRACLVDLVGILLVPKLMLNLWKKCRSSSRRGSRSKVNNFSPRRKNR